jgi:hypothetical protein
VQQVHSIPARLITQTMITLLNKCRGRQSELDVQHCDSVQTVTGSVLCAAPELGHCQDGVMSPLSWSMCP